MRLWKSKSAKQNKAAATKTPEKDYSGYVEHPRFGRAPRHTGLDVRPFSPGITLHWNAVSRAELGRIIGWLMKDVPDAESGLPPRTLPRIPATAILADPSRQNNATCPVTHYYDVEKVCRGCQRPFIFFAEEQKHWYEELRFPLEADCVRCPECRKKEQTLARKRRQFEQLSHVKDRDWKANLTMAECALTLVEQGIFHFRQTERVRALLRKVPAEARDDRYQDLQLRLKHLLAGRGPAKAKHPPASC